VRVRFRVGISVNDTMKVNPNPDVTFSLTLTLTLTITPFFFPAAPKILRSMKMVESVGTRSSKTAQNSF
jgi:hypothetical protein